MSEHRTLALGAFALLGLFACFGPARPAGAFGSTNGCLVEGDCQSVVCDTSADTAITFGQAGAIAFACNIPTKPGPNLAQSFATNGGIAGAFASGAGIAKSAADGVGSVAGALAQVSTINGIVWPTSGISTTAGNTGVALASAIHPFAQSGPSSGGGAALGVSAFGGETIAAPDVVMAPGQVGVVCVGDAVAAASNGVDSWLCVNGSIVIAGH